MARPNNIQQEIYENRICSMVGQELIKHYGGYKWYVECHLYAGVVNVRNLDLDGEYGFVIGLDTLLQETDPKIVMRAGGEVLERFRLDALPRKGDLLLPTAGDLNA